MVSYQHSGSPSSIPEIKDSLSVCSIFKCHKRKSGIVHLITYYRCLEELIRQLIIHPWVRNLPLMQSATEKPISTLQCAKFQEHNRFF